jgi:dCMP deaminase
MKPTDISTKSVNIAVRIERDNHFLNIAKEIGLQSNCMKHKVGSVICRKDRIISSGYNGTPPKFTNCSVRYAHGMDSIDHREWSAKFEIHAEMNSIIFAGKENINVEDSVLYCTLQPCHNCLKHIIAAGIRTVIYKSDHKSNNYDADTDMLINLCDITVLQFESEAYYTTLNEQYRGSKLVWDK